MKQKGFLEKEEIRTASGRNRLSAPKALKKNLFIETEIGKQGSHEKRIEGVGGAVTEKGRAQSSIGRSCNIYAVFGVGCYDEESRIAGPRGISEKEAFCYAERGIKTHKTTLS